MSKFASEIEAIQYIFEDLLQRYMVQMKESCKVNAALYVLAEHIFYGSGD